MKLTVGPEFMAELAEVKAALSHLVPDGNLETVLRVCFQKTLEVCTRRGLTRYPGDRADLAVGYGAHDALW